MLVSSSVLSQAYECLQRKCVSGQIHVEIEREIEREKETERNRDSDRETEIV